MNNNKDVYLEIFKGVLFRPANAFRNIEAIGFGMPIYVIFSFGCFVVFLKSFWRKKISGNYFENEIINNIISFLNIPQVEWVIALLCFALFLFLLCKISHWLSQKGSDKKLILSIMSISSIGILLNIVFLIAHPIFSIKIIYLLRHFSFLWIFYLTILAIKEIKNLSYLKSIGLFLVSGFPSVIIMGLPGLAPYLLWLVF